jgi:hypothetical protein
MLVLIGYALPARRPENSRHAAAIAVAPSRPLISAMKLLPACPSGQSPDYGQPGG